MLNIDTRENLHKKSDGKYVIFGYDTQVAEYPSHWHNYIEIIIVLNGTLTINVAGKPCTLTRNNAIIIWPGELHSILPNTHPLTMVLQFDPNPMLQFPSINRGYQLSHRTRIISDAAQPALFTSLKEAASKIRTGVEQEGNGKDPYLDYHQYTVICNLMIEIFNYEQSDAELIASREPGKAGSNIKKIQNACSYISRHYDTDLSMTDVAEYVDMSKYYFSRSFEKYTGCSFSTYLARCRMDRAKELLADPENKITDIAMRAGFGSLSSFNRVFRSIENITPSDFRKLHHK